MPARLLLLLICSFFTQVCISAQVLHKPIPDKLVVLTFDDAVKSHYSYVAPLLKKYGFDATFFVCEFQPDFADTSKYMTWAQMQELSKWGFEIGNHTWHHKHVNKINKQGLISELEYIDQKCDSLRIEKPVSFAYPGYDTYAPAVETLQQQGILLARTGGDRVYNPQKDNPYFIPGFTVLDTNKDLITGALKQAKDGNIVILTFHGIPDTAHDWVTTSPTLFEEYLAILVQQHYKVISMKGLLQYINIDEARKIPFPSPEKNK